MQKCKKICLHHFLLITLYAIFLWCVTKKYPFSFTFTNHTKGSYAQRSLWFIFKPLKLNTWNFRFRKLTFGGTFFLNIPSIYAKILGGNLFQPREFLQSGWKVEGGEEEKEKRRRKKKKVGENNGQLCFVRHHGWRTQARLDQKKKKKRK